MESEEEDNEENNEENICDGILKAAAKSDGFFKHQQVNIGVDQSNVTFLSIDTGWRSRLEWRGESQNSTRIVGEQTSSFPSEVWKISKVVLPTNNQSSIFPVRISWTISRTFGRETLRSSFIWQKLGSLLVGRLGSRE